MTRTSRVGGIIPHVHVGSTGCRHDMSFRCVQNIPIHKSKLVWHKDHSPSQYPHCHYMVYCIYKHVLYIHQLFTLAILKTFELGMLLLLLPLEADHPTSPCSAQRPAVPSPAQSTTRHRRVPHAKPRGRRSRRARYVEDRSINKSTISKLHEINRLAPWKTWILKHGGLGKVTPFEYGQCWYLC